MGKKIRIEAVIETNGDLFVDDSLLKRTINSLGEVISCNINNNYDDSKPEINKAKELQTDSSSFSDISHLINEANKIYFGTLSIDERKFVAVSILHTSNLDKIKKDSNFKKNLIKTSTLKLKVDNKYVDQLFNQDENSSSLELLKEKFLEGDMIQMFTYIWEKVLSIGEEDDFEIELIENTSEKFGLEKPTINDTKKIGKERAKISKAIDSIETGKVAYNKLKAFEKTILLCLMLTECSTIDGKISPEDLKVLKSVFSDQFNITSNAIPVILEKKLGYSITKKVEQVEVYREKYELVEFLWEKFLSSETEVNDNEMALVRKWVRRLDISDVESEGARKDVEENLGPKEE